MTNDNGKEKRIVFRSARVFDGDSSALIEGKDVIVAGGFIEEVSAPDPGNVEQAEVIE